MEKGQSQSAPNISNRPTQCLGVKHFFMKTPPLCVFIKSGEIPEDKAFSNFLLSAFEKLKTIQHPNLCQYIDLIVNDHGKFISSNWI